MSDPLGVLQRLAGRTLILDENHSTYLRAPKGEPAPAMARLSNFAMHEDGSIWAESVEWTAHGKDVYAGGEYVGLSPIVLFDPSPDTGQNNGVLGNVVDIHSVALVNDPNLPMPALNAAELKMTVEKKPETVVAPVAETPAPVSLDAVKALIGEALSPFSALLQGMTEKLATLTAAPAPVAAANVAEVAAQLLSRDVEAAAEKYIGAGKLKNTPESRTFFKSLCSTQAALNSACAYFETAAPIVATNATDLQAPPSGDNKPASAEEIKICRMFGREPKDLK